MDFFAHQAQARSLTRWLVWLYLAAVAGVVLALCAAAAAAYTLGVLYSGALPLRPGFSPPSQGLFPTAWAVFWHGVPWGVLQAVAVAALAVIAGASLWKMIALREGSEAVMDLLGGRRVERVGASLAETRLLNVVEEMAIASGVSVPSVYVLDHESGINALSAGYSPNEAAIGVTLGALNRFSREEMQAVIGHEFSHILNGDMRLNVRLLGVLHGIVVVGGIGQHMVRSSLAGAIRATRETAKVSPVTLSLGLVIALIGWVGLAFARLIKAAVARQREYLADASSVQFTRNPRGIAGALDTIRASRASTFVWSGHAEEASHMFFAQAVAVWWGGLFSTHPPIEERVRRAHPGFRAKEYREQRGTTRPEDRDVAVIDANGEVVKVVAAGVAPLAEAHPVARVLAGADTALAAAVLVASAGSASAAHLDHAARLLARVPAGLRERIAGAEGAAQLLHALALDADPLVRAAQQRLLAARLGPAAADAVDSLAADVARLGPELRLPLVELALPALRARPQPERDACAALLRELCHADGRVTMTEFVLLTLVIEHLRPDAGRARPLRYRDVGEAAEHARIALACLALAGGAQSGDVATAYARGAAQLGITSGMPPASALGLDRLVDAIEQLRMLAPLAMPRLLKACAEVVLADGRFTTDEIDLMRAFAAALDCPLPPVLTEGSAPPAG